MTDFLFYVFSAITLISGVAVVVNKNAVNGAMFMILSFVGMAALFILLEAYFLAVLQVLVYAGAVMVLFLFIIMLLDVKHEPQVRYHKPSIIASVLGLTVLALGVGYLFAQPGTMLNGDMQAVAVAEFPQGDNAFEYTTSPKSFGLGLFTKYMLPFQVSGFLLLVAMMGVILLSKRHAAHESEEGK